MSQTMTTPRMGAQTVAAALDLEYRLARLYGDVRDALVISHQLVGASHDSSDAIYRALVLIGNAQSKLDSLFCHAADIDRETRADEPPF